MVYACQNQGIEDWPPSQKVWHNLFEWVAILCAQCKLCQLFLLQDGCSLSRVLLTDWFKQIFAPAGTLGNFSNRSFNIGMATFAAYISVSDNLIQALGQWSSQCLPAVNKDSVRGFGIPFPEVIFPSPHPCASVAVCSSERYVLPMGGSLLSYFRVARFFLGEF